MPYQVNFEADFVEQRSRPSNFFRLILAIPLWIVAGVWGIAVYIVVFIAWFALLFTGRYPLGLYNFVGSYLRFWGRATAYISLMTDAYPPFGGADDPAYPVRLQLAPPLAKYGRWRVFLRIPIAVLAEIVLFMSYPAMFLFAAVASAPAFNWLLIVNDGRARLSLHRLTWVYVAFSIRLNAWAFLLAQDFPPLLSEWQRSAAAVAEGTAPAEGAAPAT